ncbi:carbamoyltransferase [Synechococcus phage S-SZBM1]|uniref:Carbamoyltransferase n=1 Tax=Synechococcus phage S-SZBM1 TaxID=2926475 RepID=A0AC61TSQ3_9CAUD|nr:Nol-like carbamoyltransferase [Synechococcus phage S-SZBM1]UNH61270.1 carbamoyltransferase [Synechococcus phage S-SZBM1]
MKFLGLRLEDHDSNITYTDGAEVKYCATERVFGIKHHGFDNNWQWQDILNGWGVRVDELDAIAVITDTVEFSAGELYREVSMGFPCKTFAIDHHYAHVLSLWPLGDVPHTNYVFDGYGNNERSHSLFLGDSLTVSHDVNRTGSVGISMASVGKTLGFTSDEWGLDLAGKVMGLAGYGLIDQNYYEKIKAYPLSRIRDIWNYDSWTRKWDDFDINWLRTVHELTGDKLASYIGTYDDVVGYTGGIAQNCVFNGKILATGQQVMIPPHASDCGLSLGAVEFLRKHYEQDEFSNSGFPFWQSTDEITDSPSDETIQKAAESLASGGIVAWYQGAGEIGPRALGHRSILMNARDPMAKDIINSRVKHREPFRPFGASVLREDVNTYFECDYDVPYMNVSVPVKDKQLKSITHVDGTCRIHTVSGDDPFTLLLSKYKELTGDSVVLNTSLNIGGRPIASKHWEAKELFTKKDIDCLVIGDEIRT